MAMEGIQLSVERTGLKNDIAVIKVGGYIDTTTSAELEHSLESLLKAGTYNIVIDLSNVDYISSAGWGIFISEIKGIREKGGDLKLAGMIPDVYEVFELLEFHYILKAYDTLEEAVRDFNGGAGPVIHMPIESEREEVETRPVDLPTAATVEKRPVVDMRRYAGKGEDKIEEIIQQLVIENPENGTIKIMRELNGPRFGYIKLNWFQVRKYLKQLGLDTKKKRIEFFKQKSML